MSDNTRYGTSSLASDPKLSAEEQAKQRRWRYATWGTTALIVIAAISVGVYYFVGSSVVDIVPASVGIPASVKTAKIQSWQSAYNDGQTPQLMEQQSDLEWKVTDTAPKPDDDPTASFVRVDDSKVYQEIFGFGGAFTESASLQFSKLSAEKQQEIIDLYFSKNGSAYTFGRVPMGSTDFSPYSYTHDNVTDDIYLEHFDNEVSHDTETIIPFVQKALKENPDIRLFLSPWSPPAWMKRPDPKNNYTQSMNGSALPIGLLDDKRDAWALYFSKFVSAYKEHNISFWGLTPQNEPEFSAPWEACGQDAMYQAVFVNQFLGPVMRRDHPEVKIMAFDHNRGSVLQWAETMYDHDATQYVDGMAFHWYFDTREMDGVEYHERLNDTHYVNPDKFMIASENCNCPDVATGDLAWFRGQRYAHDIMADFNNWVNAWVDWNLMLDHKGGPNHKGNQCDSPIIVDESDQDYFIQPMYYFIQHFSHFVPPGSKRIDVDVQAKFKEPGDAKLYVRYPSENHACDFSARQFFEITKDKKIQISGTSNCIDKIPRPWVGPHVEVVECQYTKQQWDFNPETGRISMDDACLTLNHGSQADGARIMVEPCANVPADAAYAQWDLTDGTLRSRATPDKCVTAGYSFVQSTAFVTPKNKKVVVIMNENTVPTEFELSYGDAVLQATVPANGIRTLTWE